MREREDRRTFVLIPYKRIGQKGRGLSVSTEPTEAMSVQKILLCSLLLGVRLLVEFTEAVLIQFSELLSTGSPGSKAQAQEHILRQSSIFRNGEWASVQGL